MSKMKHHHRMVAIHDRYPESHITVDGETFKVLPREGGPLILVAKQVVDEWVEEDARHPHLPEVLPSEQPADAKEEEILAAIHRRFPGAHVSRLGENTNIVFKTKVTVVKLPVIEAWVAQDAAVLANKETMAAMSLITGGALTINEARVEPPDTPDADEPTAAPTP